jgi:hypothetical protein
LTRRAVVVFSPPIDINVAGAIFLVGEPVIYAMAVRNSVAKHRIIPFGK